MNTFLQVIMERWINVFDSPKVPKVFVSLLIAFSFFFLLESRGEKNEEHAENG